MNDKNTCESLVTCCSTKPCVQVRPLLSGDQAAEVEALFKIMANQTRLRVLHALVRAGEMCVTALAETLNMKPQAISNQLQRLVDRSMVASRRNGNNIYYRILDRCVIDLLDRGLCLMEDAKARSDLSLAPSGQAVSGNEDSPVQRSLQEPYSPSNPLT